MALVYLMLLELVFVSEEEAHVRNKTQQKNPGFNIFQYMEELCHEAVTLKNVTAIINDKSPYCAAQHLAERESTNHMN